MNIGWNISSHGIATNADPDLGGIIDVNLPTGTWFVVFNSNHIETIEGLPSRDSAFAAHRAAIEAIYDLN